MRDRDREREDSRSLGGVGKRKEQEKRVDIFRHIRAAPNCPLVI